MENDLKYKQPQRFVTTQQKRQAVKILHLNILDLNEYIEDQVLGNPLLEMPEISVATKEMARLDRKKTALEKNEAADYTDNEQYFYESEERELSYIEQIPYEDSTLTSHLLTQLGTMQIDKNELRVARFIIDALDQTGYLTVSIEDVAKAVSVDLEQAEKVLRIIQAFDPAGVAARDLRECLLIQMSSFAQVDIDLELPKKIIENHLIDLAENRISNITRSLKVSTAAAQEACDFIKTLEPKPGRSFGWTEEKRYIAPDVLIDKINGQYVINLSERTAPKLKVNSQYKKYLADQNIDKNIAKYINDKLQSAMWLIASVDQRRDAIYKVVESVLRHQRAFFDDSKQPKKYLTISQVAEETGLRESTVNRVIKDKYIQFNSSIFEIKYFFDNGIPE